MLGESPQLHGPAVLTVSTLRADTEENVLLVFDAAGLGLFCVAGTRKAVDHGLGPVAAALLGVTTAAGGGVLRDVLARETPALIRADSELYAVPALAGALVVGVASTVGVHSPVLAAGVAAGIVVVRVLALVRHWRGPRARGRRRPGGPQASGRTSHGQDPLDT